MDDNDSLDRTLGDLIGSSSPTIADEDGAYRVIVHRARDRVVRRRLVASAVTMTLVAAVAIAGVIAGQRPNQVRVRAHSDPPTTTSQPSVDGSLDLAKGTAFGIAPGNGVTPESVLDTLTPVLGPSTRDTGWYITELRSNEDCLGNMRQRILRWGNLSFAFWNPQQSPAQFTLWGWALGKTADQREPQPIVDTPTVAATTSDGIGIGTPFVEVQARYGTRVQVAADNKTVFMSTSSNGVVVFSLKDGNVSGIQSRLSFC